MKIVLSFLLAAFLAGCATPGVQMPRGARIAPIGIVGDELDLRVVGTTIFQNKSERIDVSDWKMDEVAERAAISAIESAGLIAKPSPAGARKDIGTLSFVNFTSSYCFRAARKVCARQRGTPVPTTCSSLPGHRTRFPIRFSQRASTSPDTAYTSGLFWAGAAA